MSSPGEGERPLAWIGALAPLRLHAFRALWIAVLVSNLGTWMQTVGAQWLLVRGADAALLVSLVQVVDTLPDFAFGLLGGVLTDIVDRRRLLIALNAFLAAVGAALTFLTAIGAMPPALLLTFTFLLGTASVVALPAYQSLVNDIVPRSEVASAAALGAMNINIARAVGPAVAGLLIAQVGVATVFALNTASFAFYALVVIVWRPNLPPREGRREPFVSALRAGTRYVRYSTEVRRIFLRTALFVLPYSALSALLPIAATQRLGLGASGYGVLLAASGIGAIAGAFLLPYANARLSVNQLVALAGVVCAASMVAIVAVPYVWVAIALLAPAGACAILVLSNLSASLQLFLPAWVRGRGLSVHQMVLFGSLGAGSLVFGLIANQTGVVFSLVLAAAVLLIATATIAVWPFPEVSALDRTRWSWPEPRLAPDVAPTDGPVIVTVTYTVSRENEAEFVEAMEPMRRARLTTGAIQWGLFRDAEAPRQFTEFFVVASWQEHLRQHRERLTRTEEEIEARAQRFSTTEPVSKHYLGARGDGGGPFEADTNGDKED